MIPFELEAFTAILIVSVATILSVYLWVLKKNGWIGNSSRLTEPNLREKPSPVVMEKGPSVIEKERQEPDEIKQARQFAEQEEKKDPAEDYKKTFLKRGLTQKPIEAQKPSQVRDVPPRCTHHFGYLGSLGKSEEIPDECYSCSKLIQCFKETNN